MQCDLMQDMYGLSYTLKIHIIEDHLGDRLRTTGQTLQKEYGEYKKRQHSLVSHWNSLNINKLEIQGPMGPSF